MQEPTKVAALQLQIARSVFSQAKHIYDVPQSTHHVQLNRIVKATIIFHQQSDHFAYYA